MDYLLFFNRSRTGGCFFEQLNGSPVVFLAFAMGETASPEYNGGECGGGMTSPKAKASENKQLKCESEKKCPMSVNGYKFY
jgi:hypothetical protein